MEKIPILRRLPRRMIFMPAFHFLILGACALFTLYLEGGNAVTSTSSNDLTMDDSTYKTPNKLLQPSKIKIVPPDWSWISKGLASNDTRKLNSYEFIKNASHIMY
ncbi:hypothetical protein CEXT_618561 [Caerostris extrusa]|uniref:Uncharacterized protein n=1 Tax=Caerostris extrusa TaxID=172846 RepID=A0AAV4P4J6_CAEEX|nr:hypothetical protein CEXT_618561 [Caerostris extrusa]